MTRFTVAFVLAHVALLARADTEIRNFALTESPSVALPHTANWLVLSHAKQSMYLNVTSAQNVSQFEQSNCAGFGQLRLTDEEHVCPHELWVVLDTEAPKWSGYTKFTLRASWPAYQPTNVFMDIFDPVELTNSASRADATSMTTRNKYARLRFVHTGVLSPSHASDDDTARYLVSLHLILEPLLFGVLPQSVLPVVISILVILACGIPISRRISDYLQKVANKASSELKIHRNKES
ncbi:hypothetical protein CVT24_011695 [Panaeolus cyanescens]|uniref:Uncharacterized protein n=1 Tax=Panaeolus cyanescens TaxID=181874 RepID=A0A409YH54_9AGAR|nr:hypothetical protein CVT24_011695 [Panaeolus cyanescens]